MIKLHIKREVDKFNKSIKSGRLKIIDYDMVNEFRTTPFILEDSTDIYVLATVGSDEFVVAGPFDIIGYEESMTVEAIKSAIVYF